LILLVVAATGISAYLVSARMKRVYRGATEVQVQPISGASQSQELLNLFQNPTLVLQTDVKLIDMKPDSIVGAWKRKDDIYRMAQANKAFAHYRW